MGRLPHPESGDPVGPLSRRRYFGLLLVAIVYGAAAVYFLGVLHARLEPDTACYLRGSCAWSSPLVALAGKLGGLPAIAAASAAGICFLGLAVAWFGSCKRSLALLAVLVVLPGFTGLTAGPDALGAAGAVLAWSWARRWPAIALLHLEAALCVAAGWIARRLRLEGARLVPALAGCLAFAGVSIIGLLRHEPPSHSALRYMLPGGAIAVAYSGAES